VKAAMTAEARTVRNVRLRPGNGVLVKHEDLVLLCEIPPDGQDSVRSILGAAKAAASADQPGRHLVRHLVKTLASADRFPSLCAFGAVDDGIAVAVHGKARLRITMPDGELRLDGQDAVTIVDRVLAGPVLSITGEIGEEVSGFCPWSELTSGVVRADGIEYGPLGGPGAGADIPELAADDPAPQGESPAAPPEDGLRIVGVSCAKGHFNDPTNQYCAVCGIGLTQAGRRLAQQVRPALGVLMLDDGTSLPMTKDCVIGRAPETAPEASTGELTLVRLAGPGVADVHARVRLEGWTAVLVDAGSLAGTFLREPDANQWTRLPSDGRAILRPGAIVAVGSRQLRYDSYRRLR
jgi:hypothetical protein